MSLKKSNADYCFRMNSKKIATALILFAAMLVNQCSVALEVPTAVDAQKSGTSLEILVKGRDMYIRKCGSCHGLYLPEKLTAVQWQTSMEKMQKKSKINQEHKEMILKFLSSKCKVRH